MADQTLASLTAATPATGGLLYGTQGGADRKFTLSAAGAAVVESATAAEQRTALGLGALSTQNGVTPGSTVTSGASTGDILTSDGSLVQKLTPGTGVTTALGNAVNGSGGMLTYGIIGTSGAAVPLLSAANTFGATQTMPSLITSGGQLTSPQAATSTTASLDFYANTNAPSWPANNDKWFTWSTDVNGVKAEIMKLYALDATTYGLRGNFGIYPNQIRPAIDGGTLDIVNGTFNFVQALIQLSQYGPNPDFFKWDLTYPMLFTATNHSYQFGNSTSAQKISVMGSYTSSTNYETGVIDWQTTANTLRIGSDVGTGGGTARDVQFIRGGVTTIMLGANTTDHAQPVKLPNYIVSALPDAATCGAGTMAFVSDATSTTAYSTVAGGGSSKALVISDGTNWIIH